MSWRKEELKERLARSERLYSGAEALKIDPTGEEGVRQMRALLGLGDFVTNVNIPNIGQIPNLPFGAWWRPTRISAPTRCSRCWPGRCPLRSTRW